MDKHKGTNTRIYAQTQQHRLVVMEIHTPTPPRQCEAYVRDLSRCRCRASFRKLSNSRKIKSGTEINSSLHSSNHIQYHTVRHMKLQIHHRCFACFSHKTVRPWNQRCTRFQKTALRSLSSHFRGTKSQQQQLGALNEFSMSYRYLYIKGGGGGI